MPIRIPRVVTRSHAKQGRSEMHRGPQTMLGTLVSGEAGEDDVRVELLKHVSTTDLMRACLVSKGAMVCDSTESALVDRRIVESDAIIKGQERLLEMEAKIVPGSPSAFQHRLEYIKGLNARKVRLTHHKDLEISIQCVYYWRLRKCIDNMAERANELLKDKNAIIEKQALQIVALKRLYKAK